MATASHSITLTYGRDKNGNEDHPNAAVLTYSDVQKYFKRLRFDGFPLRYFAVGEYGSQKGRAHWHLMVYWQGKVPPHELQKTYMQDQWPHGHSFWDKPSTAAIRYVCKYLTKEVDGKGRQYHLSMSKKPPLGHEYFKRLAERYVTQGIAPQEPFYWFGDVRDQEDKPIRFYMSGVSLDNFCQSYLDQWRERRGGHPPSSPLLEEYCDRVARLPHEIRADGFRVRVPYPWITPPWGSAIQSPKRTIRISTKVQRAGFTGPITAREGGHGKEKSS